MSTVKVPAGLGLDFAQSSEESKKSASTISQARLTTSSSWQTDAANVSRFSSLSRASPQVPRFDTASLRSIRGMQGLLMAEIGEAMVELDPSGHGSVFKEGQRIAYASASPGTTSINMHPRSSMIPAAGVLVRSETYLNFGASPTRSSAELESLLGNSNSRLKPGATMLPSSKHSHLGKTVKKAKRDLVSLEQAKPRARVEVDIVLENDAYVQGSYLRGHIKLRVRKRSKKEAPMLLAGAKVRVIGFECLSSAKERHTFYQCAAPLSDITGSSSSLYEAEPDVEGFAQAREGVHTISFTMQLPVQGPYGVAKGVPSLQSGVAVQYIAMVSVKVKDSSSGKRSIAHFYRNCEIWPRIDPTVALAPATRPLQATTSKSIAMLSNSKVKLTALLHRLTFIAGQRCYVRVAVLNETKKTVKSLTLTLVRTTTIFKPKPALDAGRTLSVDPDACETSTAHKVVVETVLEMGHRAAKGHASAKGWWTGVGPGEELEFSHFILLPPDALSVIRGRLLEVEYSIRISLSAGSLTSDVFVTLPIRIINFMSIDPTPNNPGVASYTRTVQRRRSIDGELGSDAPSMNPSSITVREETEIMHGGHSMVPNHQRLPCDVEPLVHPSPAAHAGYEGVPPDTPGLRIANPDRWSAEIPPIPARAAEDSSAYSSDARSDFVSSASSVDVSTTESESESSRSIRLGNMDLDDPDSDEEVDFVVERALVDDKSASTSRFSEDDVPSSPCAFRSLGRRPSGPRARERHVERGRKGYPGARAAVHPPLPQDGISSFAMRVQEKLASLAAAVIQPEYSAEDEVTPRLGHGDVDYEGTRAPVSSPRLPSLEGMRGSRQLPRPPPMDSSTSASSISTSTSHCDEMPESGMSNASLTDAALDGCALPSRTTSTSSVPSVYSSASRPSLSRGPSDWPLSSSVPPSPRAHAERPTEGLRATGTSSNSVKGRIAELEERVRYAHDTGSAYV
ncbi:hypothetical protein BKA93DRAFT_185275 [Sparassis latifolia]